MIEETDIKHGQARYFNLESLRGLAALTVAISHSYSALSYSGIDELFSGLIFVVANASAAVTIFFVLSGAVLGLSLDHNWDRLPKRYIIFLVKRIFRIYPAHLLVLFIICISLLPIAIDNLEILEHSSIWFGGIYRTKQTADSIIKNALLVRSFLNPVTWTLTVEMVVALIFPLLHVISRAKNKCSSLLQIATFFFLVMVAMLNTDRRIVPHIYKFYLGLLIPVYGPALTSYVKQANASQSTSHLLGLSVVLLLAEKQLQYFSHGLVEAFGATLLVHLLMKEGGDWLFRLPMIRRLGQYSYSFYLWHFPILWLMNFELQTISITHAFLHKYAFLAGSMICMVSVCATYAIASASYWYIERRMVLLGRNVAASLGKEKFSQFPQR